MNVQYTCSEKRKFVKFLYFTDSVWLWWLLVLCFLSASIFRLICWRNFFSPIVSFFLPQHCVFLMTVQSEYCNNNDNNNTMKDLFFKLNPSLWKFFKICLVWSISFTVPSWALKKADCSYNTLINESEYGLIFLLYIFSVKMAAFIRWCTRGIGSATERNWSWKRRRSYRFIRNFGKSRVPKAINYSLRYHVGSAMEWN